MKLTVQSTLQLNTKAEIPVLGLGVWQIPDGEPTIQAVEWALQAGYRHIDTAKFYANEAGVGEGIRRSGIPREEIWVTTKLWPIDITNAGKALKTSLDKLGLDYVDLYLMHWPIPGLVTRSWKAMEGLLEHGGARAVGVSNYSVGQLESVLEVAKTPPAVNQVKFSAFGYDQERLDFCTKHGIVTEAYSPLTRGKKLGDEHLNQIAAGYTKSPAQVLLRWALQKGTVVIPKSQNQERIAQNIDIFDFELSDEDMKTLDGFKE